MRPMPSASGLSKRHMLAVVTTAVLISPAWAGIGGSRDPLLGDKERLKTAGWTATFDPRLLVTTLPDKAALQRTANKLVGQSLHYLPDKEVVKVSSPTKHAIARIAREAFEQTIMEERPIIKTGQAGSLRYQVGAVRYSGDIYVRGSKVESGGGLAPFVALMSASHARSLEAKITIYNIPAEAEIFFDGEPTTQKGYHRVYATPSLEVGKNYPYEVVARWQEKGKEIKRSRKVSVTGGDAINVDFYDHRHKILFKWMRHTGKRKTAEERSFAYSPDHKTILKVLDTGADTPKTVRLYDVATDRALGPKINLFYTAGGERVVALAVAPDGKTIATAISLPNFTHYTIVDAWDATTGDRVGAYSGTPLLREIFELSFFQNGKFVLIVALPGEK